MSVIEGKVEVNVPATEAYDQWNRFAELPYFMEDVIEVRPADDRILHWRAKMGQQEVAWDTEIVENVPGKQIVMTSDTGPLSSSKVSFLPISESRTLVKYEVNYRPKGLVHSVKQWLGSPVSEIDRDLKRFAALVESQDRLIEPPPSPEPETLSDVSLQHTHTDEPLPLSNLGTTGSTSQEQLSGDDRSWSEAAAGSSPHTASDKTGDADVQQVPLRNNEERRRSERRHVSADIDEHRGLPNKAVRAASVEWRKLTEGIERMLTTFRQKPYFSVSHWQQTPAKLRYTPPVDATESGGRLTIFADVPGMAIEDLRIDIDNDLLTLRGERRERSHIEDTRSYCSERVYGRFTRTIRLPSFVDTKGAAAVLRNGVLEITLPTSKRHEGHRVEVHSRMT